MVIISDCIYSYRVRIMKVKKIKIEKSDLIAKHLPANYTDAFECEFTTKEEISADDIMIAFWTNSPKWIDQLFALRDLIVKPLGIQTSNGRNKELFANAIRNCGSYRFIETVAKSDTETVISADDKHLKMYFSTKTDKVNNQKQKLTVSTIVHFHNWFGKVYFFVIYPFHHFIVPSMVRYSMKKLSL